MKFFNSKYPNMGFYINNEVKYFHGGEYTANTKEEQEFLKTVPNVTWEEPRKPTTRAKKTTPAEVGE